MGKKYKYKSVDFQKIADNVNLVKLSSIYDNPCGDVAYAEVNDVILDALISDTRANESYNRYVRDWEIAGAFNETNGTLIVSKDQSKVENEDEKKQIIQLFGMLSVTQRRRLYLYIQDKMTYEEIAELDGVSIASTYRSFLRAFQHLRKYGQFLQGVSVSNWVELLIAPIF